MRRLLSFSGGGFISRLEPRLQAIVEWCQSYRRIADIGAHAGHLAMALARQGHEVYATEVTPRGYQVLAGSVAGTGVVPCLGDGLDALNQAPVDGIVIAGMGYGTILHILDHAPLPYRPLPYIVQPMQGALRLRQALQARGFGWRRANVVEDRHRYYPLWEIVRGQGHMWEGEIPEELAVSPLYPAYLRQELARIPDVPALPVSQRNLRQQLWEAISRYDG